MVGKPEEYATECWQIGDLRLDAGRREVHRGDDLIALPGLSFDLLLALARAAPNLLSPDQMLEQVWPGLVVGPETVSQRIKLLRQALQDDAENPRYLLVQRGRGCRIIPPAVRMAARQPTSPLEEAPPAGGERSPATAPPSPAKRPLMLLAGVAVVAFATLGGLLARHFDAEVPPGGSPSPAATLAARETTVAVLRFDMLGPDRTGQEVSRGLPEIVLDRLAHIPQLGLIARESSFAVDPLQADSRQLGSRLGARFLVTGSVQQQDQMLRVTARLIDSTTQRVLWSRRFDRPLAQLFALQDEIATGVATALHTRLDLVAAETRESRARVDSHLAFVRARALLGRNTIADSLAAARELERVVQSDPQFAEAHAGLFDARMQMAGLALEDMDAARLRHAPLLQKALQLDPKSPAAQLAQALWADLDNAARESAFESAVEADPASSRALTAYSEFLDITDGSSPGARVRGSGFFPRAAAGTALVRADSERSRRAGELLDHAISRDPLSPRPRFRRIQRGFDSQGSVEKLMEGLLELDPDYYPALQRVAKYQWLLHASPSQAIALIERAIARDPLNPWARHTAVAFYLDVGDLQAAAQVASETAASRVTAAPVLALHQGDPTGAARAAESPASYVFGFNESWGSAEALRDAALLAGNPGPATRLLMQRYDLGNDPPYRISVRNFRPYILLSSLQKAAGRRDRAAAIASAVVEWIDADTAFGSVYKLRTRAEAQQLLDNPRQALADLRLAYLRDRDFTEWWYTLDRNPMFASLRDSPEFRALRDAATDFSREESMALERMREAGLVPRRGGSAK